MYPFSTSKASGQPSRLNWGAGIIAIYICLGVSVLFAQHRRIAETEYANEMERMMIEAAFRGNLVKVNDYLSKGARIDARHGRSAAFKRPDGTGIGGSENWTALMAAIDSDQVDIATQLVLKKASILVDDGWGRTALCMLADKTTSRKVYDELAALLIKNGADVNAKVGVYVDGPDGETALHRAVLNGHADLVRMLVSAGADVNAKTSEGDTPLDYVAKFRNTPQMRRLLVGARKDSPK